MIKVMAISDLHGNLLDINNFEVHDITIICGDISPLKIQASNKKMKKWLVNEFKPWAESIPSRKVYFIAGNHDWVFSRDRDFGPSIFPLEDKVSYLCQSGDTFYHYDKEYKIFGTPYCKQFYNWAFMEEEGLLRSLYSVIPDNLDILITHDAPYGVSDILLQKEYYTGDHIGNKPLMESVIEKSPKYLLHGHLHSTSREFEDLNTTKVINCSVLDENYNVVYRPVYFNIE